MSARRKWGTALIAAAVAASIPAQAWAASDEAVQAGVISVTGIVALLFAVALLVEMLVLRKLASGAAIAENITYAVLAVMCLAASVLVGWVSRLVPAGFTAEQARLGSDMLALAAMALFFVYFWRVRRAMSRFLGRLSDMEQEVVGALDPDAELEDRGE